MAVGLAAAATGCSFLMLGDDYSKAGEVASPEAGSEGQPGEDGGRPDDAAGSDGPRDANVPFCAAQAGATLCDDFDGEDLAVVWDTVTSKTDDADAPTLDPTNAVSRPNSVRMYLLPLPGDKAASAGLERKTKKIATSSTRLSFDIFLDDVDDSSSVYYTQLSFAYEGSDIEYSLFLYLVKGIAYLSEEFPYVSATARHKFTKNVRPKQWSHVEIEAMANPPELTATLDGATVVGPITPLPGGLGGPVTAFVGLSYASGTESALEVHYDNVRLDVN